MPNLSSTYQRTRTQNKPDGLKREYDKLKKSYSFKKEDIIPTLNEEDFNLDEYLDNKIMQNAQMTNRLKSTLKRFDSKFGQKRSVISEKKNSSGDK